MKIMHFTGPHEALAHMRPACTHNNCRADEHYLQIERASKHTAKADVLAEHNRRLVLFQRNVQCIVDRLEHVHLFGGAGRIRRRPHIRLIGEM